MSINKHTNINLHRVIIFLWKEYSFWNWASMCTRKYRIKRFVMKHPFPYERSPASPWTCYYCIKSKSLLWCDSFHPRHQTDSQIVFKRQFWAKDIFMKTRKYWVIMTIFNVIMCLYCRYSNLPFRDWHLLCWVSLSSYFYPAFKSYSMVLVSFIQW